MESTFAGVECSEFLSTRGDTQRKHHETQMTRNPPPPPRTVFVHFERQARISDLMSHPLTKLGQGDRITARKRRHTRCAPDDRTDTDLIFLDHSVVVSRSMLSVMEPLALRHACGHQLQRSHGSRPSKTHLHLSDRQHRCSLPQHDVVNFSLVLLHERGQSNSPFRLISVAFFSTSCE